MSVAFDCIKLFHEKSHAEQFMRGELRFTRIKTYIDIECKVKGVRDKYEGCAKVQDGVVPFIDIGQLERTITGNPDIPSKLAKVSEAIETMTYQGVEETFVLCSTDIYEALESKEDIEEQYKHAPQFSDDYLSFASEYKHAVFFNSLEVKEKIAKYAKDKKLMFLDYLIAYRDEPFAVDELIEKTGTTDVRKHIFVKPTDFEHEHEYRYVLLPSPQQIKDGFTVVDDKSKDHFYANVGAIHALGFPVVIR